MKRIESDDLRRAMAVNDAVAKEHEMATRKDPTALERELAVSIEGMAAVAAEYSVEREERIVEEPLEAATTAFTMGGLTALRARKLAA